MDYYIKELQDEEFMSHDWESSSYTLDLATSILIPFFMKFYSVKVVRGMVTFGKSKPTNVFVI